MQDRTLIVDSAAYLGRGHRALMVHSTSDFYLMSLYRNVSRYVLRNQAEADLYFTSTPLSYYVDPS